MSKASRYRAWLLILSLSCAFASSRPVNKALTDDVRNYGHIQISQTPKSIVVNTDPIQITFSLASGLASYSWNKVGRISDAYSAARLETLRKSTDYSTHRFLSSDIQALIDGLGRGVRLSFLNTEPGKPALRQTYYLYWLNRPISNQGRKSSVGVILFPSNFLGGGSPLLNAYLLKMSFSARASHAVRLSLSHFAEILATRISIGLPPARNRSLAFVRSVCAIRLWGTAGDASRLMMKLTTGSEFAD